MSGQDEQAAILASELHWFGGQLGSPKVFDFGTNFSAQPTLRETRSATSLEISDGSARQITVVREGSRWDILIDEV